VLIAQAEAWNVGVTPLEVRILEAYTELLVSYEKANVIGTRNRSAILLEHVLDSLSCLTSPVFEPSSKVLDVGSGGGLPGLVLAIVRPDLSVTLLEATTKKVSFLTTAIETLSLHNVSLLHGRAEDLGRERGLRESFDIVTARAVASLPVLLEYCAPFSRVGGYVVAMKGRLSQEEAIAGEAAAKRLGLGNFDSQRVTFLKGLAQKERRLAILRKETRTPSGYPRRVGLPKKRPLGGI